MLDILIYLLIMVIVLGIVYWVIGLFPIPQPFHNIIIAIFALICLIILLGMLFGGISMPHPLLR